MYRSACNASALALAIIACGTPIFAAGAQSVQPEPFLQIELAIDGNIGVTFLRKWDVTLDLATGKAVTPANAN